MDCAPQPFTLAQSKEGKGSNFAFWQPCHGPGPGGGGWDTDGTTAKREAEEQSESDDGDWVRRNGIEGTTWAGTAEATERGEDWVASPKISGDSWICGVDGTLRVMALLAGDGVEGMGVLRGTFILPQLISSSQLDWFLS